jgi:hypothetical protein
MSLSNIYESEAGFNENLTIATLDLDNDYQTATRPEDGDGIIVFGPLAATLIDVTAGYLSEFTKPMTIIGDTIISPGWSRLPDYSVGYIVADEYPKIDCSDTGEPPGLVVKNKPFFVINQTPNTYQLSLTANGPAVSFCLPGVNCALQLWSSADEFIKAWDGYFDPANYKAWSLDNIIRNLPTIKAFLDDLAKFRWVTIAQLLGVANKSHSMDLNTFGVLLAKAVPILEKLAVEFYKYSMDSGSKVAKLVPIVNLIKDGINAYNTILVITRGIESYKPIYDLVVKACQVWSNPTIIGSIAQDVLQAAQSYATNIANQQFEFLKQQILSLRVQIPEVVAKAIL